MLVLVFHLCKYFVDDRTVLNEPGKERLSGVWVCASTAEGKCGLEFTSDACLTAFLDLSIEIRCAKVNMM